MIPVSCNRNELILQPMYQSDGLDFICSIPRLRFPSLQAAVVTAWGPISNDRPVDRERREDACEGQPYVHLHQLYKVISHIFNSSSP